MTVDSDKTVGGPLSSGSKAVLVKGHLDSVADSNTSANADPSLPRIWGNVSVCQQVGLETLDGAMDIL